MSDKIKALGFSKVQEAKGIVEYRLDSNGLKVLLSENHAKPVVTFMALFHVGSRNEAVGFTGSTHFLEHLMFKGTPAHNPQDGNGVFEMMKPLGNLLNATTWFDRTNYFECVPAEHLPLCIELEADRMRNLMLRVDDRNSEMTVVRNEMERGENEPDRVMMGEMFAVAFREHPYHHPTIGWRSDVEGVSLERMKEFYDVFYWPNNCTVMVRGDFDTVEALELIAKHYGKIPASPHPIPTVYTVEPPQEGERRFEINRPGDLPRVWAGFHIPQAAHEDTYALAAMRAVLGGSGSKSSRLYKRLIDSGLCASASASHMELRDPGLFMVSGTVSAEHSVDEVEAAMFDEVAKLAAEPVTLDELNRAKNANRKSTILGALDPMGWANMIAEGEASVDWKWVIEYDDNFDKVTPADVQRVAAKYFGRNNRTVGHFIPKSEAPDESAPEAAESVPAAAAEPVQAKTSMADSVVTRTLANGIKVQVQSNRGSGAVSINGKLRAGGVFGGGVELLPELTAFLLTRGSSKYSKTQVAELLEDMGPGASRLSFSPDTFAVSFGGTVVATDFKQYVDIVGDLLRNPLFLDEEVARAKQQFASFLTKNANNTGRVGQNALMRALYDSTSPYFGKTYAELGDELAGITVDRIRQFHSEHYSPKSLIISIVGDIDAAEAFALVESVFGDWDGAEPKQWDVSQGILPGGKRNRIDVKMPGKKNTDIIIGAPVPVARTAADFCAARIADLALGGDTIGSRLGKVVRVKHGLTYGINSHYDDISFGNAPWLITLTVNPENIDKALGLVDEVVEEFLTEGISDREMSDLTEQAAAGFQVGLRTDAAVAGVLSQFTFLGLPLSELDNYPQRVKSVTKEEVNEAIRKYLRLDGATTVVCGTF
ncbi:MAG: insulinase family protein [Candidatus Melainabacteria bacterium]|nr:MAG: insulinase family protein [Candidatus Melainabacteria bacterium]